MGDLHSIAKTASSTATQTEITDIKGLRSKRKFTPQLNFKCPNVMAIHECLPQFVVFYSHCEQFSYFAYETE